MKDNNSLGLKKISADQDHWDMFFSKLAHAESGAAIQCKQIAQLYKEQGNSSQSKKYLELASEEEQHFSIIKSITENMIALDRTSEKVYEGNYMSKTRNPLEKMASVHLVFEPAALAFLGYIYQNYEKINADFNKSIKIRDALALVLRDEVSHVYEGKCDIKTLIKSSNKNDIDLTKRAMRKHKAFIVVGMKKVFEKTEESKKHLNEMLNRFEFYSDKAAEGIFL